MEWQPVLLACYDKVPGVASLSRHLIDLCVAAQCREPRERRGKGVNATLAARGSEERTNILRRGTED